MFGREHIMSKITLRIRGQTIDILSSASISLNTQITKNPKTQKSKPVILGSLNSSEERKQEYDQQGSLLLVY